MRRLIFAFALPLVFPAVASADEHPDKQACIDAHGQSQELRNAKHLLDAKAHLLSCSDASCPGIVKQDCADLLAEVIASIPTVSITVALGPEAITDAVIEVDGAKWQDVGVAREVDPGPHEVVVTHAKLGRASRRFTAVEGRKNESIAIDLGSPGPTHERSAAPPVGAIVLFGVTLGVLAVGLGFEGWAVSTKDDVEGSCAGLDEAACEALDSTKDWRTKHLVANVAYGVSGAALLGGVIWWVVEATRRAPPRSATVQFDVGPAGAFIGVRRTF